MVKPSISVALCTYNGEKYLEEQLNSIAFQTLLPDELVICDDGSTDQTIDIIRRYSDSSPIPVYLYQNEYNIGVAKNFFNAINLCKSDWVMLCDQDDIWLKSRIEMFAEAVNRFAGSNMIISDGKIVDDNLHESHHTLFKDFHLSKNEQNIINRGESYRILVRHVFATGAAMMIRRTWASTVPTPIHDYLHDEWLAWFSGQSMHLISDPSFLYRQHANQVTGVNSSFRGQMERLVAPQQKSSRTIEQAIRRSEILYDSLQKYSIN